MPKIPHTGYLRGARALVSSGDVTTAPAEVLQIGHLIDGEYLVRDGERIVSAAGGGGGGGGAPTGAQYVVLALDAGLSAERRLRVGAGLSLTDGGANADVTIAPDADLAALEGLTGTGLAVRTGADAWTLSPASTVVAQGDPVPPRYPWEVTDPQGRLVEYMAVTQGAATSNSQPPTGQIWYTPHVEDQDTATYDAIVLGRAGLVAGAAHNLALYADDDGQPGALLWSLGSTATDAGITYAFTFASGTWDASGAAYKDGSDRLVLTRGQRIWRAVQRGPTGTPSLRTIPISNHRALGVSTAGNWGAYTHWEELQAYGAWPDPAGSSSALVGEEDPIPYLPLRQV